jgi:hypothetical protein
VYSATDTSGNQSFQAANVFVPIHLAGGPDPLSLSVSDDREASRIDWNEVDGAVHYNVVRGDIGNLEESADAIRTGPLACLAARVPPGIGQVTDASAPPLGNAFFYLVEYDDGLPTSYGSPSGAKPILADACR